MVRGDAHPAANTKTQSASYLLLALYLGLSFLTLMIGGALTAAGMGTWYDSLQLPPWQPPAWVFSPVWFLLMTLLAVATWMVTVRGQRGRLLSTALVLYGIQLVLNVLWSLLFFAMHMPSLSLVEIIVLDLVLLGMVITYGRISLIAAALITPYLLWLGLATAINIWIVWHN